LRACSHRCSQRKKIEKASNKSLPALRYLLHPVLLALDRKLARRGEVLAGRENAARVERPPELLHDGDRRVGLGVADVRSLHDAETVFSGDGTVTLGCEEVGKR
jgi:hypothetical protein